MPAYRIKLSAKFGRTLADLFRSHYRKDPHGSKQFKELLEKFTERLRHDGPSALPDVACESWPHGHAQPGHTLYKWRFSMPNRRGAAARGRLIFLEQSEAKVVILAWIYTHSEFAKRPADRDLAIVLKELELLPEQEP